VESGKESECPKNVKRFEVLCAFQWNAGSLGNEMKKPNNFYLRNAMLARVFARATCLSVCLSVCPSHAGIVSKLRKKENCGR